MLYDNLADSAIVFSGITPNFLESLLKTLAKAYERCFRKKHDAKVSKTFRMYTYRSRSIQLTINFSH